VGNSLCTYPDCREPAALLLTARIAPRAHRHEDLCLAHVGPRASEFLRASSTDGVSVSVGRIWEDVEAEAHRG